MAKSRYGGAVDVERAAALYAQGWTLRQIGAELGVHWSTVGQQLRRAGIIVRSGGPPSHPASTQQILDPRDQGLTWNEVAKQVHMTVSGAWSLIGIPVHRSPRAWAVGSRFSPTRLIRTLRLGSERPSVIMSAEPPTRTELTAARRAAHSLAALGRARVLHVAGAEADADAGDRSHLGVGEAECDHERPSGSEGWRLQEIRLPVGKVPTTTPRPLATLDALSGMRPTVLD
jgi:hypothetical protein